MKNNMTWRERLASLRPFEHRILFGAVALLVGILLLTIGFWRTLLLAIVVGLGYVVGKWRDGALDPTTIPIINRIF